jgi:hypothetical protein
MPLPLLIILTCDNGNLSAFPGGSMFLAMTGQCFWRFGLLVGQCWWLFTVSGYYQLLEAISDPKNQEYDSMIEWVGEGYDPEAFDMTKVDRDLKRLR